MRRVPTIALVVVLLCGMLHADLGLILSEPLPEGLAKWTQSGHSAVYLSNVCADSPIHLRPCRPDENGVVISNYSDFKENSRYEWNAAPLSTYLYGVEDANLRPLYASRELRLALQDRFRTAVLGGMCTTYDCIHNLDANWRDMVAESFIRGMYLFVVKTSPEQDQRFIAEFNSRPNVNRYSGFRNNCANFAMRVVNFYFPGAAHGDRLNDFGMVTPKGIARSFAHYAARHKELNYRVLHLAQIPGDFPASNQVRSGTELAFRSKRWLIPMLFRSHELILFSATYLITGRFNPQKEFERHSGTQIGSAETWNAYRNAYKQLMEASGPQSGTVSILKLAEDYDKRASVEIDPAGLAWAEVPGRSGTRRIGLDVGNVLSADSDRELAFRMLMAKAGTELRSSGSRRESISEFAQDWKLLEESHADNSEHSASVARSAVSGESNEP